jgi:hypothetical protein
MTAITPEFMEWYESTEYFLLLFPDQASAAAAALGRRGGESAAAAGSSAFWSRELGKPVSYIDPKKLFMILDVSQGRIQTKVLYRDRVGWINLFDWLGLKKIF